MSCTTTSPFLDGNYHCSLSYFQIMSIIPSTSQIPLHPSLNLLKTAMPQTSWTHIIHIQITPKIQLLWASIMIQYHLRIIYINLSLLITPTIIWHCIFAMLVCLRQQFIQLLNLSEIKAYDYLWLMWYIKLHCRKVHGTWSITSSTYHFSEYCSIQWQTWTNSKSGTGWLKTQP